MGWLGLNDGNKKIFAGGGLGPDGAPLARGVDSQPADACLTAGTLIVEATHPTNDPQKLVGASGADFWPAQLMLHVWPQGRATLQIGDGAAGLQLVTEFPRCTPDERLRLIFRWSAAFNAVWLAVESPGRGMFAVSRRAGPPPIPVAMLAQLFELPLCEGVGFLALSDRAEDFGPGPALAEGTPLRTPVGWRKVEDLRPGDLVLTADEGPVPLRDISRRELPWAGSYAPSRLEGETGPVLVSQAARVLVRVPGMRHEGLAGACEVGEAATPTARFLRYIDVSFDRAHLVNAGGHWIETRAPTPGPVSRPRVAGPATGRLAGAA